MLSMPENWWALILQFFRECTLGRQGRVVHERSEGVKVSNAVNTNSRASKPITVLEAYLENTIQALGFIQVTYTHGEIAVEFRLPGDNSWLTLLSIRNVFRGKPVEEDHWRKA
jgi:hypothetical protein